MVHSVYRTGGSSIFEELIKAHANVNGSVFGGVPVILLAAGNGGVPVW